MCNTFSHMIKSSKNKEEIKQIMFLYYGSHNVVYKPTPLPQLEYAVEA